MPDWENHVNDKPSSANAEGIFEPFKPEDVPWEEFSKGCRFGIRFRQLSEYGGGFHIGVGMEELEPGKQAYPAHYHMLEEEHMMILSGSLTLRLGGKTYDMTAGDYVCFPAGQKAGHALINNGDEVCRYLMIGERNDHEVVRYTDTDRVGVRLTGEGFRAGETVGYWDGEDTGE